MWGRLGKGESTLRTALARVGLSGEGALTGAILSERCLMFRSVLVIGVLFSMISANANAQKAAGFVQAEWVANGGNVVPTLDALTVLKFEHGLSANAFFLVTEGWAQAYMGPAWAPTDWLEVGVSVGGQQIDGELAARYAATLWLGTDIYSLLAIVEFDNATFRGESDGVWYDLRAMAQPLAWLTVGIEARRFAGVGPRIDLKIPQTPLSVWCTWTPFELEKLDGQLGHLSRFMFGALASF